MIENRTPNKSQFNETEKTITRRSNKNQPQINKMVSLIRQEELNSRVSEIISPQVNLTDILYLPDQVIVG